MTLFTKNIECRQFVIFKKRYGMISEQVSVGSKLVCVSNDFDETKQPFKLTNINVPKIGVTYTVREVVVTTHGTGIRLEEIINDVFYYGDINAYAEPIFGLSHFN